MANVAGTGTTFNLPNYTGELYHTTPTDTPLLAALGGINAGRTNDKVVDEWQTGDNAAPAQTAALEGADPTYENRDRADAFNVKQIYQYGFSVTYTKQAATGMLGTLGDNTDPAVNVTGTNPVTGEIEYQRKLKMVRMQRDIEYTFLNGTYAFPTDNATPRKTRGLLAAVTTNDVAASGGALSKTMVDTAMRNLADVGAPRMSVVAICNSWNRVQLSNIYGYAPQDRSYGGLSIKQIETDFGLVGIMYNRYIPADDILFVDMSLVNPTHLPIPGKGTVFVEPKPSTGSSWNFQLYGEIGLMYGPEQWHAKITNTATS